MSVSSNTVEHLFYDVTGLWSKVQSVRQVIFDSHPLPTLGWQPTQLEGPIL